MSTFRVEPCNSNIDEKAWATRASISSARCVLEIEEKIWAEAQASGLVQTTQPTIEDAIPLFIQAINELEANMTAAIDQRVLMTDRCSSYTDYVQTAYPHATAVKLETIKLGDGVEILQEAQKDAHIARPGGISVGMVDAETILHSITKELLGLYDLLYRDETGVRQSLRELIHQRPGEALSEEKTIVVGIEAVGIEEGGETIPYARALDAVNTNFNTSIGADLQPRRNVPL